MNAWCAVAVAVAVAVVLLLAIMINFRRVARRERRKRL